MLMELLKCYILVRDQQFTKNPDINFFKSVYKSYSNFVKIPKI